MAVNMLCRRLGLLAALIAAFAGCCVALLIDIDQNTASRSIPADCGGCRQRGGT
jgi:hypothetical protein